MENNPVGWFEIHVQDMERAKKFYDPVPAPTFKIEFADPSATFIR